MVRFAHPIFMARNVKKTARMPAMKFPKLQKKLRLGGTGSASGTRAAMLASRAPTEGRSRHTTEKGRTQKTKRYY
jgi:hypothetical protein